MRKQDFKFECKCGAKASKIIMYSSFKLDEIVGYYCASCENIYIFDGYSKPQTFEKDLVNFRK